MVTEKWHLYPTEDPILAISTPPGRGAVGVVRLSGCDLLPRLAGVVHPTSVALRDIQARRMYRCQVVDPGDGEALDDGLLVFFPAPRSFTGEDMVELHLHGNPVILNRVLEVLKERGFRLAEPGEFTYRAFLNGKLDLTQAEALNDLIQAQALWSARSALRQLEGSLARKIRAWKEDLVDLIALFEAAVDFADEEGLNVFDGTRPQQRIQGLLDALREVLATFRAGRAVREGLRVVLVGKPNVGKSSLFNAILRSPRAIVTPVAGTTRDFLEELVHVEGFPVHLIDTAGLRLTGEKVERIGVHRAREQIGRADLILWLVDVSVPLDEQDEWIYRQIRGRPILGVINKIDLPPAWETSELESRYAGLSWLRVSCKTGAGLADLLAALRGRVVEMEQQIRAEDVVVTNIRHQEEMQRAYGALEQALQRWREGAPEPIVCDDLRHALAALDRVTGETDVEQILGRIFARFCVGK